VTKNGKSVSSKSNDDGSVEFETTEDGKYMIFRQ
jgi:hypothetical protein